MLRRALSPLYFVCSREALASISPQRERLSVPHTNSPLHPLLLLLPVHVLLLAV